MARQVNEQQIERFRTLVSRRRALGCLAAAGAAVLLPGRSSHAGNDAACQLINRESAGPFVADGSNGPDVLTSPAVFRSDIRPNLDGSNPQPGVKFLLQMSVVDVSRDCAPMAGAAVYLWHCNADGDYSGYPGMGQDARSGSTFLRGVQVTDSSGQVRFRTIYPGRYPGRATHFHARIYQDESFNTPLRTTQFAFDDARTSQVYAASSAYQESGAARAVTNDQDFLFRDGFENQLLELSGDSESGYGGSIVVGVQG
ncbi:hypothetical protein [Marinobacter sp.]|uniref:dioxygenase family protein n=1 Tax=Marinobacter sp. TaxID=50741 RepID=UPI00384E8D8A